MVRLFKLIFLLSIFLLWPSFVNGQKIGPCMPYEIAKQNLLSVYKEVPIGHGIAQNGWLTELFLNLETKSWTIIQVQPNTMMSCTRSRGNSWIIIDGMVEADFTVENKK